MRGGASGAIAGRVQVRTPDEWRAALQRLLDAPGVLAEIEAVLLDRSHPQWARALEFASDRAYGRPSQQVEHQGTFTLQHVVTYSEDDSGE
jgi:hypothetical protein